MCLLSVCLGVYAGQGCVLVCGGAAVLGESVSCGGGRECELWRWERC